jgi:mRNA interferase RelE/StbE
LARVVLARRAQADVLHLEWPVADAVVDALGLLEREPEAGHLLRGRLRGLRSLRVGSYRAIYQVGDGGATVRVLTVRHRAVAYETDPR